MPITIQITPGSPLPIYQQIVMQVRQALATGTLKAGEMLPSVRALAEELVINPNTVAKAYNTLSHEGLVESLAGRGLMIAERRNVFTKEEILRRVDPLITQLASEAIASQIPFEELVSLIEKKLQSQGSAAPHGARNTPHDGESS